MNASVLGGLSLVVAALFLIDLMGPRVYTAAAHSQTDAISSPKVEKKVSIANPPTTNGHVPAEKQKGLNGHVPAEKQNGLNGHLPAERPKDLDLVKENNNKEINKEAKKETQLLETSLDDETKLDIDEMLEKTKFGSLRNGIEGGNYVRLSDPISEPDRVHYERELAKFNERYFRDFLDNFAGKLTVRENYLPEPHTPVFAKVKSGRLKSLYDEESPNYERNQSNYEKKSPSKAKTIPSPTLQQLEDYLKGSSRSRRADTPALFPMEPIEEKETTDTEGRASGTPTDPGYVQYTAGRWPDKHRELRTPRHSPT